MAETVKFNHINKIPALTWNWLKMNRDSADLEKPAFFEAEIGSVPRGFSVISEGAVNLGQFPLLKSGIGEELSDYLEKNVFKGIGQIITLEESASEPFVLNFSFKADSDGAVSGDSSKNLAASQIIYAKKGTEGTVIFVYEGADSSQIDSIIRTRVYAEENARIHVVKVQLLGKNQNQIDETSGLARENSEIHFTQIELGGNHVNSGLSVGLSEHKSRFRSELAFIAKGEQHFDFNHEVVHTGSETDTKMLVKGVVDGNAVKTYRGTIDFKNGCRGSTGDEQEETLLMSKTVINKSIPVILCDEEDVAGTHGATLGRLGADELFYMQSRGIGEGEAKKIVSRAKVMSVAKTIGDEKLISDIERFLDERETEPN